MQVGLFCTPNLLSGTALVVIRKVGPKHLMMNNLAAVHCALYFSFKFAVIMSEINPTHHRSITARHFSDEDFRRGAVQCGTARSTFF